jgi:nucleoside-diphosphate-sugar epimerase
VKVFVTGATGYIGGSIAAALRTAGHEVAGLVRSAPKAEQLRALGVTPVPGDLDDAAVLAREARAADAVVHTADADHRASVEAMLGALAGSGKLFVHTSGSSIVGDGAWGEASATIFEDETPFTPAPGRAARVAVNERVLAAARDGVRAVVIAPSLIYGEGRGLHRESIQVPKLVALARKHGVPRHVGRGENIWSNVHLDDLVDLYLRVLEKGTAGASYYAENGETSMREVCAAIGRALGMNGRTAPLTREESIAEFGEGAATYTYGSNSRVRATRARRDLGWSPHAPALLDSIRV